MITSVPSSRPKVDRYILWRKSLETDERRYTIRRFQVNNTENHHKFEAPRNFLKNFKSTPMDLVPIRLFNVHVPPFLHKNPSPQSFLQAQEPPHPSLHTDGATFRRGKPRRRLFR